MGRKTKNMTIQMHNKINSLLAIGESKHQAKQEYRARCEANGEKWNPAKSPKIHSIATTEAYRQTASEFGQWLKENHKEIKTLDTMTKDICYEYLKSRETDGCSAWTVSKDLAAINKIYDLGLTKADGGLQERHMDDITRSRNACDHDKQYNPENYKEQILFASAFGCRRESISGGQYQVKEDVSIYQNSNGDVYARLVEKGGRFREAPCLNAFKEEVLNTFNVQEGEAMNKAQFVEAYNASSETSLFDSYTAKIDNHALRAEYATALYAQELPNATSDSSYKHLNEETALKVSEALGHNRLSVVLHYIRL